MARGALVLGMAMLLAACAAPPADSERLALASGDAPFIDALLDGAPRPPRAVSGHLLLPRMGAPPYAAVVLVHGAQGQGMQDWRYMRLFAERGFAVLAVDSFGPRGVDRTVTDQTLVSEASMLLDAYAALDALARDPRIDGERVALVGFSKGGTVALYAALERFRAALAPPGRRFAAHVAYYPWCGLRPLDLRGTGAPLLVQIGGLDDVTPARLCAELLAEMRAAAPDAAIALVVHPEAAHAFDHPLLGLVDLPVVGQVPGRCRIQEESPGRFVEQSSRLEVRGDTVKQVLAACSGDRATAGGDAEATAAADRWTLAWLGGMRGD